MLLVARVDSRRVLALGVAGLVPAALVTLLLVHQPSIGARRLYPLLRGSIALLGLCLALATLITWACSPSRRSRGSLCGLAWAGVTGLLCIGPFLESTPRPRLYALELDDGDVLWATTAGGWGAANRRRRAGCRRHRVGTLVGLNPRTGDDGISARGRCRLDGCRDRLPRTTPSGRDRSPAEDAARWPSSRPARAATPTYGLAAPMVRRAAPSSSSTRRTANRCWRSGLPAMAVVTSGSPTIDANGAAVVVAGGEQIAALDADDGHLRWTQSVVALGKSRGYALPGSRPAGHRHATPSCFLSATPDT